MRKMRVRVPVHTGWAADRSAVLRPTELDAYETATPGLVVHRAPRARSGEIRLGPEWNLTHAPSGLAVALYRATRRECLELAERLGQLGIDWTRRKPEGTPEAWAAAQRLCWRGALTPDESRRGRL